MTRTLGPRGGKRPSTNRPHPRKPPETPISTPPQPGLRSANPIAPPTPPPSPLLGRPTLYTQEIGDEILTRLAAGEMLYQICESSHLPGFSTVLAWQDQDRPKGFQEAYNAARRSQAEALAERSIGQSVDMIRGERVPIIDPQTGLQAIGEDGSPLWEMRKPDAKGAEVLHKVTSWYAGVIHKARFGAKTEVTISDPAAAKSALARLLGVEPEQLPEE